MSNQTREKNPVVQGMAAGCVCVCARDYFMTFLQIVILIIVFTILCYVIDPALLSAH